MQSPNVFDRARQLSLPSNEKSTLRSDADRILYLLENASVRLTDECRFFVRLDVEELGPGIPRMRLQALPLSEELRRLASDSKYLAYTGSYDFGHTSPDWEAILSLGIFGLRERVFSEGQRQPEKAAYFAILTEIYDATLDFLTRVSCEVRALGRVEMADSLLAMTHRAPETMYEALQTILVYYALQHHLEGTNVRTLGRLDTLLYPYYQKEKEKTPALLRDFLCEIDSYRIRANMPFAIGGRLPDGSSAVSELSYAIVRAYLALDLPYTKFHLLVAQNTPTDLLELVFEGVRQGKNSVVFLSDERIVEGLVRLGETPEDAMRYHVVGCYECGGYGELTCSCNARVNLVKALELALCQGREMQSGKLLGIAHERMLESFEDLFEAFCNEVRHQLDKAISLTEGYEALYPQLHSAPYFTSTYEKALARGGDLYSDSTATYNNSSLNALGLASVTDSLYAIRRLVYEEKRMTLGELTEILQNDWQGAEALRLQILRHYPKYGMGLDEVDELARRVVDLLVQRVSGRPNKRGGVWRLGLFSINWRHEFGKKTGASANGRRNGETLSQNTGATFGADRNGITAHLRSVASLDTASTPNGAIVDLDLHKSAAELPHLTATLRTFFRLGGFGVHYNVLDKDTLLDAKEHPERYPTLQVRLCGWNALFAKLSEKEQDEFISRAEH